MKGGVAGIAERGRDIAEFRIVDPVSGEDCPPGTPGEIWTRGPMNSLGYLDRPADTAALFAEGGWLRTGELISREQIIAGGVRAFPDALTQLFAGVNVGKLILAVSRA